MPIATSYPGVYVQEISSGVRTITGVSTSVAAFVGFFSKGPMEKAVQVFNMADFTLEFGGLHAQSEAGYAIQQFFANGGAEAWVIRTATGAEQASVEILDGIGSSSKAMEVTAINPGSWGNRLRVRIDPISPSLANAESNPFNMTVFLVEESDGREMAVQSEEFLGLTVNASDARFVETVVNDRFSGSKLVQVSVEKNANNPLQNGTLSGELPSELVITDDTPQLTVTIGSEENSGTATLTNKPTTIAQARTLLEKAIQEARPELRAFSSASVTIVGDHLRIMAGPTDSNSRVTFAVAAEDSTSAGELQLETAQTNVQTYALGSKVIAGTAQGGGTPGDNGTLPNGTALRGRRSDKSGIYALEDVDLFNLLCIPRASVVGDDALSADEAFAVQRAAIDYCEERRAFFLMDTPTGRDEEQEIKEWLEENAGLRHKNAALYFPRIEIPDPLNGFRLRSVGACGTIAGLYARTDSTRGVWKAPAGTEATLKNAKQLEYCLTDRQNGTLNPLAINCLRNFPVYGPVCWGARTLDGSDQQGSEWKYVPIRRLALFIEESLFRGTQWVVFEPNDEPLWAQIRLNIGAFMHDLFRQGAFQGKAPREAYFVKCDKETNPQSDINKGIVNILVGFAPLKPAEFVMISIQQIAGQIEV